MKVSEKTIVFEYIIHSLRDWFMEMNQLTSINDFNNSNDFSILKIVKLHFLVISIDSYNDSTLLEEHDFYAMPYGPVETDIYNRLKTREDFSHFRVDNFKTEFFDPAGPDLINPDYMENIANSIEKIKTINPKIILADAGSLVDLTHQWSSWSSTYRIARNNKMFSKRIDSNLIKGDNKLLNLDFAF